VKKYVFILVLLAASLVLPGQAPAPIDERKFFESAELLHVNLTVNMRTMMKKKEGLSYPATFALKMEDGSTVAEPVMLEVRGKYRKDNCYLPPLKISFKQPGATLLRELGSLKLVNPCNVGTRENREYLLKEYLAYKLYNLVTDQSFRVRLLHITYIDSARNKKVHEEYAFLIEDMKDMARRNGCVERKRAVAYSEAAERSALTRLTLFEYMIANSDWSIAAKHNIRLMVSKEDTNAVPIAVPYDFDHAGLVKTDYALPPPALPINDVTQRFYRGFPRSMEELNEAAALYLQKKDSMLAMVQAFELLTPHTRKEMVKFLREFFDVLSEQKTIRNEFFINARKN